MKNFTRQQPRNILFQITALDITCIRGEWVADETKNNKSDLEDIPNLLQPRSMKPRHM